MVKDSAGPVQLVPWYSKVGVTVRFAVTGALVLFTELKAAMFPVPLALSPMLVLSLVHA